jgi:hypothetical protein
MGPVPLTIGNIYHVGNDAGHPGSDLANDLMNGVVGLVGKSPGPSLLDLAIFEDVGVPMRSAVAGSLSSNSQTTAALGPSLVPATPNVGVGSASVSSGSDAPRLSFIGSSNTIPFAGAITGGGSPLLYDTVDLARALLL